MTVASGVTLTIEAGVEVKVDSGKGILVEGSLVALGTSSENIVFTSSQAVRRQGTGFTSSLQMAVWMLFLM